MSDFIRNFDLEKRPLAFEAFTIVAFWTLVVMYLTLRCLCPGLYKWARWLQRSLGRAYDTMPSDGNEPGSFNPDQGDTSVVLPTEVVEEEPPRGVLSAASSTGESGLTTLLDESESVVLPVLEVDVGNAETWFSRVKGVFSSFLSSPMLWSVADWGLFFLMVRFFMGKFNILAEARGVGYRAPGALYGRLPAVSEWLVTAAIVTRAFGAIGSNQLFTAAMQLLHLMDRVLPVVNRAEFRLATELCEVCRTKASEGDPVVRLGDERFDEVGVCDRCFGIAHTCKEDELITASGRKNFVLISSIALGVTVAFMALRRTVYTTAEARVGKRNKVDAKYKDREYERKEVRYHGDVYDVRGATVAEQEEARRLFNDQEVTGGWGDIEGYEEILSGILDRRGRIDAEAAIAYVREHPDATEYEILGAIRKETPLKKVLAAIQTESRARSVGGPVKRSVEQTAPKQKGAPASEKKKKKEKSTGKPATSGSVTTAEAAGPKFSSKKVKSVALYVRAPEGADVERCGFGTRVKYQGEDGLLTVLHVCKAIGFTSANLVEFKENSVEVIFDGSAALDYLVWAPLEEFRPHIKGEMPAVATTFTDCLKADYLFWFSPTVVGEGKDHTFGYIPTTIKESTGRGRGKYITGSYVSIAGDSGHCVAFATNGAMSCAGVHVGTADNKGIILPVPSVFGNAGK